MFGLPRNSSCCTSVVTQGGTSVLLYLQVGKRYIHGDHRRIHCCSYNSDDGSWQQSWEHDSPYLEPISWNGGVTWSVSIAPPACFHHDTSTGLFSWFHQPETVDGKHVDPVLDVSATPFDPLKYLIRTRTFPCCTSRAHQRSRRIIITLQNRDYPQHHRPSIISGSETESKSDVGIDSLDGLGSGSAGVKAGTGGWLHVRRTVRTAHYHKISQKVCALHLPQHSYTHQPQPGPPGENEFIFSTVVDVDSTESGGVVKDNDGKERNNTAESEKSILGGGRPRIL